MAKHPRFAELSPEVGVLDVDAALAAAEEDGDETLPLLVEMGRATDPALRAAARALAPRLILDQTRRGTPRRHGAARQRPVRADRGGDLDIDRSIEGIVGARGEGRAPRLDELVATRWERPDLAVCLLLDRSGSMNGHRLTTAAIATAACVLRAPNEHAVVTFAARTDVLKPLLAAVPVHRTVEQVLTVRGHGTTALAAGLAEASRMLAGARASRRVVLLLSDCRHTDDVDPTAAAAALDELLILAPDGDADEARALAARSGARLATIGSVADVAAAVRTLLADSHR